MYLHAGIRRNDVFKILSPHNLEDYMLTIYNRLGQKVFETRNYALGWNGTYNGSLQPTGACVWRSKFKTLGRNKEIKGTVVLIR